MNNAITPKEGSSIDNIVTFFILLGLLSTTLGITACSSTETRSIPEPQIEEKPVEAVKAEPVKKEIRVKATHPKQYTVKKGDTLWDISSLFLKDPWYWPEIWSKNTQIKNPHLIFPGDVLTLVYVDGAPEIRVNEAAHKEVEMSSSGLPVKKLSPGIRTKSLQATIPTIPGDAIRQFLSKPRVVSREQLDNAPRIIASDEKHLILGDGARVYVRGEIDKERVRFSVFRPGDALVDPQTNEILGYEAKYSGNIHIVEYGDPASGNLTFTEREVLIGDRLLPEDKSKLENLFFPHVPDQRVDGQIISLYDALFGVAQYQIVVINKGELDGIEVGQLLATYTQGGVVRDHYDKRRSEPVQLPNERSGLVMIFKTFDRVSYALTLESRRVIHNHDFVQTPRF